MANKVEATPQTPKFAYRITDTRDAFALDKTGRLGEYKVIYFETAFGDTGSVKLPKANFTGELAREVVEAEIAEIYTLRGL